jgi:hypothetical protein
VVPEDLFIGNLGRGSFPVYALGCLGLGSVQSILRKSVSRKDLKPRLE